MTPSLPAAEAARRLWERYADEDGSAEEFAAAAARLFIQLESGLARWVGGEGFGVLRDRALKLAQAEHPALSDVSDLGRDMRTVVSVVEVYRAPAVEAGLICVIATLIDLLGRIIGGELAVRLVEQTGTPGPGQKPSVRKEAGRRG